MLLLLLLAINEKHVKCHSGQMGDTLAHQSNIFCEINLLKRQGACSEGLFAKLLDFLSLETSLLAGRPKSASPHYKAVADIVHGQKRNAKANHEFFLLLLLRTWILLWSWLGHFIVLLLSLHQDAMKM